MSELFPFSRADSSQAHDNSGRPEKNDKKHILPILVEFGTQQCSYDARLSKNDSRLFFIAKSSFDSVYPNREWRSIGMRVKQPPKNVAQVADLSAS